MRAEQIIYAWRIAGPLVIALLMLTLVFYQRTVLYLVSLWNQLEIGDYAHGYLVLAISGYLVYSNRKELIKQVPCPEYRAIVAVVAASALWMVSALVDVEMLQSVGLLLLIVSLVWTVLGNQVIRVLAFPILFIGFAIPVWSPLSPVLQNIAADAVFWAIRVLNIPALRVDNMIVLPAGALSIEEACSGLRYLLAALTLGTLYGYQNYKSLRARLIVVSAAAASAILANILRVFIIVYVGYTTDMEHELVNNHLSLGWYLFGGLVAILLVVDTLIHRMSHVVKPEASHIPDEQAVPSICNRRLQSCLAIIVAGGLISFIAPTVVYQANHLSAQPMNMIPELPLAAGGWSRSSFRADDWMPVYRGAVNQKQYYLKDNNEIALYVGYYAIQGQGEELINDLNHISNTKVWRTVYPKAHVHETGSQQVLEQMIDNGAKKQRLIWYWYNIGGKITANKYEAKALQVLSLLTGNTQSYVAAAAVSIDENSADISRQILRDFIVSIKKPLDQGLTLIEQRQ